MFHELKRAIEAVETNAPSISVDASVNGQRPWFLSDVIAGVVSDKWPELKPLVLQRLRDAASEWTDDGYAVRK